MAIPVSSFTFITNGLTAVFKDTSLNSPNAWVWNFGGAGSSSEQNPLFTFSSAGTYTISLVATNTDGSSDAYTYDITVNEDNLITIDDILGFELPASITLDQSHKNYLLTKWRLYLQAAFAIETEYINDESHYSQLQNILLSKLVIYDLLLKEAQDYLASGMNGGAVSSEGAAGGNVKRVETGPAQVEWYSSSKTLSEIFTPNDDGVSLFDEVLQDVCGLAGRLQVKLPMCRQFVTNPMVPIKTDTIKYLSSHDYLTQNYGSDS